MKIKFLVVLLAVASSFVACKKDKNAPVDDVKLPTGQYRLIESVQSDVTGKDSASVKFPVSNLSLTFDQNKKIANLTGKPESIHINGSYGVNANNALNNALITSTKVAATDNDKVVYSLLEKGDTFETKGGAVIIKAKGKGYLVFSMQK